MGKINSYTTVVPSLTDKVLGTNVDDNNNTVNFTIESMVSLTTLQNVLEAGNTATEPFNITGGEATPSSIDYLTIDSSGELSVDGKLIGSDDSEGDQEKVLSADTSGNPIWVPRLIATPPSTPTSTGIKGQMSVDTAFLYVCIATNTWRRTALSTW